MKVIYFSELPVRKWSPAELDVSGLKADANKVF